MAAPTKSREKTRVQALSQLRGVAEEVKDLLGDGLRMSSSS